MNKIGIIGTGRIGSALAYSLLNQNNVSEIFLYNRNKLKLQGIISSLKISAYSLNSKVLIKTLEFDTINELDLIIISAKNSYDPRKLMKTKNYPKWLPKNLRYCGIIQDYSLILDITKKIKDYNGIVGVITNPVEIITRLVSENIKTNKVFGFGASVDSLRISYKLYNQNSERINSSEILIIGEHGYKTKIVNNLTSKKCNNLICESIIEKSNIIGFDIVNKLGYTLFECIPVFINDINWLLSIDNSYSRSFAYNYKDFMLTQPIFHSIKKNEFESNKNYDSQELDFIKSINISLRIKYDRIINEF